MAGQGLTAAQIQRIVLSRSGAFRACYESAASRNPNLKGGVTVSGVMAHYNKVFVLGSVEVKSDVGRMLAMLGVG